MDISPLFVLQQRLHAAALAGAASCPGDARLAQACEALAPLEAAAPVFRKLGDLVRKLRAPEGEGRAAVLLEALTLADALACTQAAVAVPGEAGPVELAGQGGIVADVPYSVLQPFRGDSSRSRKSPEERLWASPALRPELFREYRLYGFLRQGLAESSALTVKLVEWLAEAGENLLPLLAEGFDPDGGKEMVWRVHMLDKALAGAANDFYCAQLDRQEGGKPESGVIRRALIRALRHRKENAARLLELCRTEKDEWTWETIFLILGRMDDPAALDWLRKEAENDPYVVLDALEYADSLPAGELVSEVVTRLAPRVVEDMLRRPAPKSELDDDELDDELDDDETEAGGRGAKKARCSILDAPAGKGRALDKLLMSMLGKPGSAIRETFRLLVTLWQERASGLEEVEAEDFMLTVALTLRNSVLYRREEELSALAEELMRTASFFFVIPYLTGMLLLRPAAEAYEAAARLLAPYGFARGRLTEEGGSLLQRIFDVADIEMSRARYSLSHGYFKGDAARCDMSTSYDLYRHDPDWAVRKIEKRACRGYTAWWWSDFLKRRLTVFRPFAEPLDARWLEAMMSPKADVGTCRLMFWLADLGDAACCARLARFWHDWMLKRLDGGKPVKFDASMPPPETLTAPVWMFFCGWTEYKGLLELWFRRYGIDTYTGFRLVHILEHIAPQTMFEELGHCLELLRRGELQPRYNDKEKACEVVEQYIADNFRSSISAHFRKSTARPA